jgi:tetratricopeptide (TPR) repeat protein
LLLLLATVCFSLATVTQLRAWNWDRRPDDAGVLQMVLGDSRRLFANHFFIKADISYHSGYYPSIFDQAQAPKDSKHMTAEEGSHEEEEHEKQMNFFVPPKDWIERFGRKFQITAHTHLENGKEREMLPWLRLSAGLDPQRIDTYTVAAFWLRKSLGKVKEAEQFLREGVRNNPQSYEILFELGCLYEESYQDHPRARGLWELALRRWNEQKPSMKEPDLLGFEKIVVRLARLEEQSGNYPKAVHYLRLAMEVSPNPEALQQQISNLEGKLAQPAPPHGEATRNR